MKFATVRTTISEDYLGRKNELYLEFDLYPVNDSEFSSRNISFGSHPVGERIDGNVSNLPNFPKEFKVIKMIEEGIIMGAMAGPLERNPVVGFNIHILRIEAIECYFKQVKGFLVQKMIMRALQEGLFQADCEIREPKMSFVLSLYSPELRQKVMELLAEYSCEVTDEEEKGDIWNISGKMLISKERGLQKRLLSVTRGNAYLETSYDGL